MVDETGSSFPASPVASLVLSRNLLPGIYVICIPYSYSNPLQTNSCGYCNMMKLLLSTFLIFFLTTFSRAASDTIIWNPQRLNWSDFKGRSDTAVNNKMHFASTFWKLTYLYRLSGNQQVEVLVYSWFDGRKSWVRPDKKNNPLLLQHEQGHFDLAEILARRFKKQLSEITFRNTNYADSMQSIFSQLLADTYSQQQDYDEDTQFGGNASEQVRWQTYISGMLKQLESFAGRRVFAKLK